MLAISPPEVILLPFEFFKKVAEESIESNKPQRNGDSEITDNAQVEKPETGQANDGKREILLRLHQGIL